MRCCILVVFHMVTHHGELILNMLNIYKKSSSILEWFYWYTSEQQTNIFLIRITPNFPFFFLTHTSHLHFKRKTRTSTVYTKMEINVELSVFSIFGHIMSKHVCVENENSGSPTFERDRPASNYSSISVFSPTPGRFVRFTISGCDDFQLVLTVRSVGFNDGFVFRTKRRTSRPDSHPRTLVDFRTRTIIAKTWTVCVCANPCRDACPAVEYGRTAVSL